MHEQAVLLYAALVMQIQAHLEGPIGIALYEWKDGQIGAASIQGGKLFPNFDELPLKERSLVAVIHLELPSA